MKGKGLHMLAFVLLIVGGLNWLLFGLFNWEIGLLFGDPGNIIAKIIYILVGLAALFELFGHKKGCMYCKGSSSAPM
jgi:hypothetical protein